LLCSESSEQFDLKDKSAEISSVPKI
jgi:hypothetical protein